VKPNTEKLLERLAERCPGRPTNTTLMVSGKIRARWHVDDDDDRYVELTDTVYGPEIVLLCCDGLHKTAVATILVDHDEVASWIWGRLVEMSNYVSERGRR